MKDFIGNADFADVVQEGGPVAGPGLFGFTVQLVGNRFEPHGESLAVIGGVSVADVHGAGESQDRLQVGLFQFFVQLGIFQGNGGLVGKGDRQV